MKGKMLWRKFVGAVLAAMMLTSTVSYADSSTPDTYVVYDDLGNEYVIYEGEVLGVLYDKDGNIKEQSIISPQQTFVDGKTITIAPSESYVTYQYTVKSDFFAGFYYYKYDSTPLTTPGGKVEISLRDSASVGGSRRTVDSGIFSTTRKYEPSESGKIVLGIDRVDANRPYYDAVYKNVGSNTLSVCIIVGRD